MMTGSTPSRSRAGWRAMMGQVVDMIGVARRPRRDTTPEAALPRGTPSTLMLGDACGSAAAGAAAACRRTVTPDAAGRGNSAVVLAVCAPRVATEADSRAATALPAMAPV